MSRYASPNEKIAYTQNLGQWDKRALFRGRFSGTDVWVTAKGITYGFRKPATKARQAKPSKKDRTVGGKARQQEKFEGYAVGVEFLGATGKGKAMGIDPKRQYNNFYSGKNRSRWVTGAQNFGAAVVKDLYPGIDLVSYVDRTSRPRYDLIIHPGADPKQIKMRFNGAKNLRVDEKGQLIYDTPLGAVTERRQVAIQAGKKAPYRFFAEQVVGADGTVTFNVDGYRKDRTLVIDPLVYSTFLGGSDEDDAMGIHLGSDDTNYVAGDTASTDFPASGGTFVGAYDIFVSSIAADGSALNWTTLLAGTDGDYTNCLAGDSTNNKLYVGGTSYSSDFPVTDSSVHDAFGDGYVAKFDGATGALEYATLLPGNNNDTVNAIALDGSNAIALGSTDSSNFATTTGAYKESPPEAVDIFVARLTASGAGRDFVTLLGGTGEDYAGDVAINGSGTIYLAGSTDSTDFPMAGTPFQSSFDDTLDGVVAALSSDGTSLLNSTYFGGDGYDRFNTLVLDGSNVFVGGLSYSSDYFTANGETYVDGGGVVTRLDDQLSTCTWSTFYGQPAMTEVIDMAMNGTDISITGMAFMDMDTTPNAVQPDWAGSDDAFVATLTPGTATPIYATYLGGSLEDCGFSLAISSTGDFRVVGCTESSDFPELNSLQSYAGDPSDAFLSSFNTTPSFYVTSDRGDNPQIAGGVGLTMEVYVIMPDTAGGDVTLTSPDPLLTVNGGTSDTVTVAPGDTEATFTVAAVGTVATTTTVTLGASIAGGPSTTFDVKVEPFVMAVDLQYPATFGPKKMLGEVHVFEPPAVDTWITMSDDSANATTSPQVLVQGGCGCSDPFTVYTFPVNTTETVTITATVGASSSQASFDLKAPGLASVKTYPSTVQAGDFSIVAVRFEAPVLGTKIIPITSSDSAKVPNTVVIVFDGQVEGYNLLMTNDFAGTKLTSVGLTATYGAQSKVGKIRLIPTAVSSFTIGRPAIAEGNSVPVRVDLLAPAMGDKVITITSSVPALIPSTTVTVLDGESFVDTTIPSNITDLKSYKNVKLVASYGPSARSATVSVNPAIQSFVLDPSTVTGGEDSTGEIVLFEELEYDLTLNLSSANSSAFFDAPSVTFTAGSVGGTFAIHTTVRGGAPRTAKITATKGTWTKSLYLTINP